MSLNISKTQYYIHNKGSTKKENNAVNRWLLTTSFFVCSNMSSLSPSNILDTYPIYGHLAGFLEKAMATQSITLAWKIPWTEEPGRLQSMGSLRVLSDLTFTFHFHALEKEMATHSRVLAWRIPGTKETGGLPSVGLHRVRHNWSNLAAAARLYIVTRLI